MYISQWVGNNSVHVIVATDECK